MIEWFNHYTLRTWRANARSHMRNYAVSIGADNGGSFAVDAEDHAVASAKTLSTTSPEVVFYNVSGHDHRRRNSARRKDVLPRLLGHELPPGVGTEVNFTCT